jgi:hypothetical protein
MRSRWIPRIALGVIIALGASFVALTSVASASVRHRRDRLSVSPHGGRSRDVHRRVHDQRVGCD